MLRVGDKVKIIDEGEIYPCYDEWAKKYNAKKWIDGGNDFDIEKLGTITNIGPHLDDKGTILLLVDMGEQEIIIDKDAVELVKRRNSNIKFVRC